MASAASRGATEGSDSEPLQVHHHFWLCLSLPGRGVGLLGLGSLALLGLLLCCLSPCAGPPRSGVGLLLLWLLAFLLCCVLVAHMIHYIFCV